MVKLPREIFAQEIKRMLEAASASIKWVQSNKELMEVLRLWGMRPQAHPSEYFRKILIYPESINHLIQFFLASKKLC